VSRLPLTIAISEYDHVRDFASGRVEAEGIDATFLTLTIEEIFFRFTRFREWDVSEMSLAKYCALKSLGDESVSAIPVFPSRVFRHSSIFVRSDSRIAGPAELAGCKVGIPEWAQTAAVYTRGLLTHDYGVALQDIDWYQAGVAEPGRREKVALKLPEGVQYTPVPDGTLNDMLLDGELDAIMTAHPPPAFEDGSGRVVRLVRDYQAVEEAYWKKTGILPIMHVVAIRGDVLRAHPWVAANLLKAFSAARDRSVARALEATASRFPIPWIAHHAEQAAASFGELFPYGIDANRVALEAFLRFAHEQGVCQELLDPEDLFPDSVHSAFKV
jgi:4,5-dihydroxyphthalate decarboxylase